MNNQELINAIARKLYRFTRRDVAEIIEVMEEIWREELARPDGYIHLHQVGKLYVEQQQLLTAGAVQKTLQQKYGGKTPRHLRRVYFRFQPAEALKQTILNGSADHE